MAKQPEPLAVYELPKTSEYLSYWPALGWVRWPAKQNGWHERVEGETPSLADGARKLPPGHAALALSLSGAPGA